MYLDKRSKGILVYLISQPNLSSKDVEWKTGLSRRQIKYSVEKINNWLDENNYPRIQRLHNGKFIIHPTLSELYAHDSFEMVENYIPSEDERALLILFILLSQHDLSLIHFTTALKVSNVTILSDMKQAQGISQSFGLEIEYSRAEGYQLSGEEWNQRNLLYYISHQLSTRYGGIALIQDFAMIDATRINTIFTQLEKIEEYLGIKFTDEKMQLLPYHIGIIFERAKKGKIIQSDFQIDYGELADTKEYIATEHLIKQEKNLPNIERLYITLQLLSANIHSGEILSENGIPHLKQALKATLQHFERNAFIQLKNKDYLIDKLMLHMKPAYYRIKYNLKSFHETSLKLDQAYVELDHYVEKSLVPLETFMDCKFPLNERLYITFFIGGHLIETKQVLSEKKKAIIVCRNGVTVSKLLKNTLSTLLPEISFFQTMSVREFNEKKPENMDIVFSPEPIQTDKSVFITNTFLTDVDKWQLRQRVMKKLYGFNDDLNIEELVSVIEKSADIHQKNKLISDLHNFFYPKENAYAVEQREGHNPDLFDLLTIETIHITDEIESWQEAIRVAAKPLLDNRTISDAYVEKMILSHDFNQPYMVLGKSMAIPHASPEDGVNKLGMSMLVVKNGVPFSKNMLIHVVVVIAPMDANQHVKAIYQLSELAANENKVQQILQADKAEEITEMIC